jgi:superfamily II DNA or RNA helicase
MCYIFFIAKDGMLYMRNTINDDIFYNKNMAKLKGSLVSSMRLFNGKIITNYMYNLVGVNKLKVPLIKGIQFVKKNFAAGSYIIKRTIQPYISCEDESDILIRIFQDDDITDTILNYLYSTIDKLQNKVVKYILDNLVEGRLLIDLPPGFGKTYVAEKMIRKTGMLKTVLVVPTKNIGSAHEDIFIRFGYKVIFYHGSNKVSEFSKCDILIIVVNSLVALGADFAVNNGFGMVIYDEIHRYVSKTNKIVYSNNHAPIVIGLTGTANDRLDKLDIINFVHFGKPLIMSDIYDDEISKKINVDSFDTSLIVAKCADTCNVVRHEATGCISYIETIKSIASNNKRNVSLCKLINTFVRKGNNVLVFFVLTDSIKAMYKLLLDGGGYIGINDGDTDVKDVKSNASVGYIINEVDYDTNSKIINSGNVCLSTYSSSGTGINFTRYNTIIYAHPRKTGYKQFNRRIYRGSGEGCHTKKRFLVFVHDFNTPLKTHYYSYNAILKEEFGDKMPKVITVSL